MSNRVKRLAAHFNVAEDNYTNIQFDAGVIRKLYVGADLRVRPEADADLRERPEADADPDKMMLQESAFGKRDLSLFASYSEAYHQLIMDIMQMQIVSVNMVLKNCLIKKLFVDGGFGKNPVYMNLLALAFPQIESIRCFGCAGIGHRCSAGGASLLE